MVHVPQSPHHVASRAFRPPFPVNRATLSISHVKDLSFLYPRGLQRNRQIMDTSDYVKNKKTHQKARF
jgi:hypothetical protein